MCANNVRPTGKQKNEQSVTLCGLGMHCKVNDIRFTQVDHSSRRWVIVNIITGVYNIILCNVMISREGRWRAWSKRGAIAGRPISGGGTARQHE